jgi:hypothetical protein
MEASNKNFDICETIIKILYEKEISIAQSCAILDFTKNKIAQDTKVGALVTFDREGL